MQSIHIAGFVHNDIKPDNIVLGSDEYRLVDFGETVSYLTEGCHYKEDELCEHSGNLLTSTADKLSGMRPSRKNDMLNLFYTMSILIHKLPYQNFYFDNI